MTMFDCNMRGGVAAFEREASWRDGMIYAACKRWKAKNSELVHARDHHSIVLTLSGGTRLTGNKISTVPRYEGADRAGCISVIPAGAERRGWYRDADMRFVALLLDPRVVAPRAELRPRINHHDRRLEMLLRRLAAELIVNEQMSTLYIEQLACAVVAHLGELGRRDATALSSVDLGHTLDLIEAQLGGRLSLDELGANVGMDADLFARKFKARLGVPPYRYVVERRIERAQERLAFGTGSLTEVALSLGFSSQSHFTRHFVRETGRTPAAWRRASRTKVPGIVQDARAPSV